jgi:DNA-binding XRE family transcriptional regulator
MNKIKNLRKKIIWDKKGMSQKELAKKVGVSCAMICALEKGKKNGSVATMKKIADILRAKIDDLI